MEKKVPITPEVEKALRDGLEHADIVQSIESFNAVGAKYMIGNIPVNACLGHLHLLSEIENPLVHPGDDGKAIMDDEATMQALYVLDGGIDAIRSLQVKKQKEMRIEKYLKMPSNDAVLSRIAQLEDECDELQAEFELEAKEHFQKFEHLGAQEIVENLVSITDEITGILDQMPSSSETKAKSKKKRSVRRVRSRS